MMDGITIDEALTLLREGKMEKGQGRLPWGSNHTLLMEIDDGERQAPVIYKPRRGERPLWDFPDGTLYKREVAAFLISEMLDWHIVPPTICREGPYGMGMVQLFIPHDPEQTYFTFGEDRTFTAQMKRIALFDHITNNADRKGGHCLLDPSGFVWAIDHGICFHTHYKLRTVIWDYAGSPVPAELLEQVECLCQKLTKGSDAYQELTDYLTPQEVNAMLRRINHILEKGTYPHPSGGRSYPWPPV